MISVSSAANHHCSNLTFYIIFAIKVISVFSQLNDLLVYFKLGLDPVFG